MIAMAVAPAPRLLLADEPTTAVDVTIQEQILSLLMDLQSESGMAMILVSHDLGVISQTCDEVAVMYGGYVVERESRDQIIDSPRHPYTHALLAAELVFEPTKRATRLQTIGGQPPSLADLPPGCPFQERCPHVRPECKEVPMTLDRPAPEHASACPFVESEMSDVAETTSPLLVAEHLVKTFPVHRSLTQVVRRSVKQRLIALDDVSVSLRAGNVLGVVGESGSGKSTLAYCLVRLLALDSGKIWVDSQDFDDLDGPALRHFRRRIQMVFQDPYSSLNPRLTVGRAIAEPARVHHLMDHSNEVAMVAELLERCGLRPQDAKRYPRQLSGGQRQRVAIARALAVKPDILIADEAVSALDVSVQAQILNLFAELQSDLGLGIIFITHQLAVISHLATDVVVLYLGRIMEQGPAPSVLGDSHHPYTRGLLQAQPTVHGERTARRPALSGELPSALAMPSGCRFHTRCPLAEPICREVDPEPVEVAPGHFSRCHVLAPSSAAISVDRPRLR